MKRILGEVLWKTENNAHDPSHDSRLDFMVPEGVKDNGSFGSYSRKNLKSLEVASVQYVENRFVVLLLVVHFPG